MTSQACNTRVHNKDESRPSHKVFAISAREERKISFESIWIALMKKKRGETVADDM
jgi:hypothetical protein